MRKLLLLTLILMPSLVWAQNARYDGIAIGPRGPVPGASIAVCNQPATTTTTPCSPLATIFSSAAGGPQANPFQADAFGNFHFYAQPSSVFTVQLYGPQINPPTVLLDQAMPGIGAVQSAFNTTLYVGGTISFWSGSDVCAQINSAYAALPSYGGSIGILPSSNGSPYNCTTPIVFNTSGKYVILFGVAPANGQNQGGASLNYTPTTATTFLTLDWTPAGGGAFVPGAGLRDINLINNSCGTAGGCGSSARGIDLGGTNAGAELGYFQNVTVEGFGTAVRNLAQVGFGQTWINTSVRYNTVGWSVPVNDFVEEHTFLGGHFSQNGTAFADAAGSQIQWIGTAFDSNTVAGLTCSNNGVFTFIAPHFENLGPTTTHYVTCTAGTVTINGGTAGDDATVGNIDYWFGFSSGEVTNLYVASQGRTVTNLFTVGNQANINVFDSTPTILTYATMGVPTSINSTFNISAINTTNIKPTFGTQVLDLTETTAPSPGGVAAHARCYSDSTAHLEECNYNNGTNFHPLRLIEQGSCSLNGVGGTCTVTWPSAFNSTPLCFAQWNGTGALTGFVKAVPGASNCVVTSSVNADTGVMQVIGVGNPD